MKMINPLDFSIERRKPVGDGFSLPTVDFNYADHLSPILNVNSADILLAFDLNVPLAQKAHCSDGSDESFDYLSRLTSNQFDVYQDTHFYNDDSYSTVLPDEFSPFLGTTFAQPFGSDSVPSDAKKCHEEDRELTVVIDKANSLCSWDEYSRDGRSSVESPSIEATYKNQQEIFDEIFRECEQKCVGLVQRLDEPAETEMEIENVVEIDLDEETFGNLELKSPTSCDFERVESIGGEYECEFWNAVADDDSSSTTSSSTHVRKKSQNRKAASKYRSKRKIERQRLKSERERLEADNRRLMGDIEDSRKEIEYLKKFLSEIRQKADS